MTNCFFILKNIKFKIDSIVIRFNKEGEFPEEKEIQVRLEAVLTTLYLLFNEGYYSSNASKVLRKDFCLEAMRLTLLLTQYAATNHPKVNALLSLMCFHASRFEARIDKNNELVDLEHHDRNKYNRDLIILGNQYLGYAVEQSDDPSISHLQAAISYCYSIAKSYEEIDWESILEFYNILIRKQRSTQIILNRLISYSKVYGADKALQELYTYKQSANFTDGTLYYAIKSELLKDLNDVYKSKVALEKAIEKSNNVLEQRYFAKKITQLA